MTARVLGYLGPEGSFTHQAAIRVAEACADDDPRPLRLQAFDDVPSIFEVVQHGGAWGVIAWENNVEGYVVPNLDALIDATGVVGFTRLSMDIAFDAFARGSQLSAPGHDEGRTLTERLDGREVVAHPHGLAQCRQFIERHHLIPVPSTSNAAACRDLAPGQIALGPTVCAGLYGLRTLAGAVQDYRGAHTDFLVVGPRGACDDIFANMRAHEREFETIIAFIPLSTGAGVLANLLDLLRDAGLNMTSFMSRPIKGHDGTYSFIATIDAAPWQTHFKLALRQVLDQGDWVKTLAVYPRRERPDPPVGTWMLPQGGIRHAAGTDHGEGADENLDGYRKKPVDEHRELLW